MIRLSGHIDVPPHRRAAVAAALPDHIRRTRAEPGCLSFRVIPDPKVKGRWQVRETFRDRKAFIAHQLRTRNSRWARITAGIPRHYSIDVIGRSGANRPGRPGKTS